MTVSDRHPEYTADREIEWRLMRDSYEGESGMKRRTILYLPMPPAWRNFPDQGASAYLAYITRARYPEILSSAVRGMAGVIHGQEWQIELPPGLEYITERATSDGLPLEMFSRRITTELLLTGRYAVATDAPPNGGDPYLVGYGAETLINWDENQDFYAFQEVDYRRDGMTWDKVLMTRVMELDETGRYVQRIFDDGIEVQRIEPTLRGGGRMDFVPVAVGGAMDMDLKPDSPPLIGVARAALAHYQINADYRMALYMAYQDTLFIYNAEKAPTAVGAGVVVSLTSAEVGKDVRAEYLSPSGNAIEAHERAMDREQQAAVRSGAQLFDNTPRGQESGEARRLRFSAETATLATIAGSSAAILERALRNAAIMAGLDPEAVVVKPPQNMLEGRLDGAEVTALVGAWEKGAFGYTTLYENLQRGRIASMERTAEQEEALILAGREALPDDQVM